MRCLLRFVSLTASALYASCCVSAQVTSMNPGYTVSLFANGLNLPWGGVIYRPATHDLLVNQEQSPQIARVDATSGAVSIFATVPPGLSGVRGAYGDGMAINSKGEVFTTLYGTGPVLRFDSNGKYLGKFPISIGSEAGVAFDQNDNFYIAEGPGNGQSTIYMYPAGNYSTASVFASGFGDVEGLAFNASGQLFAADLATGTVYQVTPGGSTLASHVLWASGISGATSVAIDPIDQSVFVGGHESPNVTRITSPGVFSTFASGFSSVEALGFDTAGNLYVPDLLGGSSGNSPGSLGRRFHTWRKHRGCDCPDYEHCAAGRCNDEAYWIRS